MRTGNNYSGARWAHSQKPRKGMVKLAAIRESGYPTGQAAPCWFHCPCGDKVPAFTGSDQTCTCGTVYDSYGWKVS